MKPTIKARVFKIRAMPVGSFWKVTVGSGGGKWCWVFPGWELAIRHAIDIVAEIREKGIVIE